MSFHQRLARLESARPDPAGDLRRQVLRAFTGDRAALWHVGRRLRKELNLDARKTGDPIDVSPLARNDPELVKAFGALPVDVKRGIIASAERQRSSTIDTRIIRAVTGPRG